MANQIQIKRSATASIPGALANGELAFTSNGDVLYIGSPNGSIVAIGGARTPGTLTANQALVANSTGYLDEIRTANAVITKVYANGAFGSDGQVLTSNSSGGIRWETPTASVTGSNTEIQFNDSGSLGSDADLTFDKATNTLSSANVVVASTTASTNTTTGALKVAGGVGVAGRINVTDIAVGNDSVYSTANGTSISTISVLATGSVNAAILSVGTNFKANTTAVVIGTGVGFNVNGSVGSAGQVLLSNGTSSYWGTDQQGVTSVSSGNGLSGGPITTTGTLSVAAGDGIISNTTGVFVYAGTGVTVNSTGVHIGQAVANTDSVTFAALNVTGNSALGDNSSDVVSINGHVNTDIIPTANVTYGLGNNTMRWSQVHVGNVHSVTGKFDGDVEIAGSLTVTGGVSNVQVTDLIVSDPLIHLASNNETSDIVDIGFIGHYSDDGGDTKRHIGLFRDSTDGVFKFFTNLVQASLDTSNTTTVNTAATSYRIATLQAYLDSGAFQTNATAITVTANSTVNVAIVANTLTLSSPLVGTSGGTGKNTMTSQAILVGNTSNGYNELSLGSTGYVLQSNGSALVYDVLDGGSF